MSQAQAIPLGDDGRITSPCTSVCKLDPQTSICVGCRRTIDEIVAWGRMSEADKRRVWQRLIRLRAE